MDSSYTQLEELKVVPIIIPNENNVKNYLDDSSKVAKKKLLLASSFCLFFMIIEVITGYLANSLALISDASHLLSDLCAFLISIFAITLANLKGNHKMSFGYHRVEIIGALCSILLIWALTIGLVYTAIKRLQQPREVNGIIMLITAGFGTLINLFITFILKVHNHGIGHNHDHNHSHTEHEHHDQSLENHSHENYSHENDTLSDHPHFDLSKDNNLLSEHQHEDVFHNKNSCSSKYNSNSNVNLNLRAAYIHAIGDLVQNIGVLIAGFLIWLMPSWSIADPICTLIFSVLVIYTTWSILTESINVLMEGSPVGIDTLALRNKLSLIRGVISIHDLHVWSLSVGKPSLACHIVVDESSFSSEILQIATSICQGEFGILHTTIQIDLNNKKEECETSAHFKCN